MPILRLPLLNGPNNRPGRSSTLTAPFSPPSTLHLRNHFSELTCQNLHSPAKFPRFQYLLDSLQPPCFSAIQPSSTIFNYFQDNLSNNTVCRSWKMRKSSQRTPQMRNRMFGKRSRKSQSITLREKPRRQSRRKNGHPRIQVIVIGLRHHSETSAFTYLLEY